ncbi:hypothetical protein K492DRAFT_196502 [Lichtheimia hyalospora FSU 10163]|nr:hypothetical protein K492DRAFT_196502 [Lichtheimia hyalospora FSU 10163]
MYQRTTATKAKTRVGSSNHVSSQDTSLKPIPITNSASRSTGIQQNQQTHHMTVNKLYAPTYRELMQIPVSRQRVSIYEKAFKHFGKADSNLSTWIIRVRAKGLPKPMKEGYQPKRRRCDQHATTSRGPNPTSSSISTSIKSILLRKASAPSMTTRNQSRKETFMADVPRPSLSKLLGQTPSIHRLSMSFSTRSKVSPRTESDQDHKYQTTTRDHRPTHPRNGIPSKLWQRHSMQPPTTTQDNRKSHHVEPTSCSTISSTLSSRIARTRKSIDLWMLGTEKKKQMDEKIQLAEDDTRTMNYKQVNVQRMATSQALNGRRMNNNGRNKKSTRCSIMSARV